MIIELSDKTIEAIAQRVKSLMEGKDDGEWVSVREAASILKISPDRMRRLRNKFPHVKAGGNNQGRLLFLKSSLMRNYIDNPK